MRKLGALAAAERRLEQSKHWGSRDVFIAGVNLTDVTTLGVIVNGEHRTLTRNADGSFTVPAEDAPLFDVTFSHKDAPRR